MSRSCRPTSRRSAGSRSTGASRKWRLRRTASASRSAATGSCRCYGRATAARSCRSRLRRSTPALSAMMDSGSGRCMRATGPSRSRCATGGPARPCAQAVSPIPAARAVRFTRTRRRVGPPSGPPRARTASGFWARDTGHAVEIQAIPAIDECTPPCFNGDGSEFLIVEGDCLSRWTFPALERTSSVVEWPWLESDDDDDDLGTCVAWAGRERAVMSTNENRLYLIDLGRRTVLDEVAIVGHEPRPSGALPRPRARDRGEQRPGVLRPRPGDPGRVGAREPTRAGRVEAPDHSSPALGRGLALGPQGSVA